MRASRKQLILDYQKAFGGEVGKTVLADLKKKNVGIIYISHKNKLVLKSLCY